MRDETISTKYDQLSGLIDKLRCKALYWAFGIYYISIPCFLKWISVLGMERQCGFVCHVVAMHLICDRLILFIWTNGRTDSKFAPSQWEAALLYNDVSHWLGVNLESALNYGRHIVTVAIAIPHANIHHIQIFIDETTIILTREA